MGRSDPGDLIGVLHRRSDLLAALAGRELTKPELEGELAVSRSTIDRGIRELESASLVERTDEGFRQTLPGKLALREYESFAGRTAGIFEGASMLTTLTRDAAFDAVMLEDATVVEAERSSPHKPVQRLYAMVEEASAARGFAPAVHPQQVATYSEQVSQGMETELVLTDEVIERLLSSYADSVEASVDDDRITVYRTDADLPYSLTILRTADGPVAAVMVYSDDGIRGCVINNAEAAVEWAERRYEAERERATRLA